MMIPSFDDIEFLVSFYGSNSSANSSWNNLDIMDYFANLSIIDTDDGDRYKRDLITYYIMGLGGMTVCCLGLVGNVLSLIVLSHRTMHSSTYSYLSALSVCDTFVLFFTMILLSKDLKKPFKGDDPWPWDAGVYPHLFPVIHPAAYAHQVISIWLTLAFTVDRYIMICHPFSSEPFCTISRARKVIVILWVAGILFNIPKFFEYHTVAIEFPYNNITKIGCDLTDFGRRNIFRKLYHSWFYIAFVCGIPFVVLAVLNSCLIHAVSLSRRRGLELNVMERRCNDTTIMLISVVILFFICQMPALVSRTIWAFEQNPAAFNNIALYTLNEVGNFLIVLNSSINILPYYFFGRKFRQKFLKIFCCCLLDYRLFRRLSLSFTQTSITGGRRPSDKLNNAQPLVIGNKNEQAEQYLTVKSNPNEIEIVHELKCLTSGQDQPVYSQ